MSYNSRISQGKNRYTILALGRSEGTTASVRTDERPDPTLEEAFIALIERQDAAPASPL